MVMDIPQLEEPTPGQFLLITDELASPGDFLLHRFLAAHLRQHRQPQRPKREQGQHENAATDNGVAILAVSEHLSRWTAIAAKSNIHLSPLLASGALIFVNVLAELQSQSDLAASTSTLTDTSLLPLFTRLATAQTTPALVILDDITSLAWLGVPTRDLVRFVRALRAFCLKTHAALVIRHHLLVRGPPDALHRALLQLCDVHADVRALASGRSGVVSGEVALHSGPSAQVQTHNHLPLPKSRIQYRLTDAAGGCVFFERGTGAAVL